MPYVSASALLRAMTFCCFEYPLIMCFPTMITAPDVDFLDFVHPPQSLSVYPSRHDGRFCHTNSMTSRGRWMRYRPIFFRRTQSHSRGADMQRAASFIAYCMSGRSGPR